MISKDKIDSAINHIRTLMADSSGTKIYIGHSGGKDSCAIVKLVELSGYDLPLVHTVKPWGTLNGTHPDTITFLYNLMSNHLGYMVPFDDFGMFLESEEWLWQIDGTRRDEAERHSRSTDIRIDGEVVCRSAMTSPIINDGVFGVNVLCPMYDWSEEEVWSFLRDYSVEISPEYDTLDINSINKYS